MGPFAPNPAASRLALLGLRLFGCIMDVVEKITTMIEPSLAAMGYDIVQLKLMDGKRKTLSLMAERKDGVVMSFDDCADISRTVSALMDVEDPISSAYNLEVCSPGLDRPLIKFSDYEQHVNYEIKCETLIPVAGRKRFKGRLLSAKGNEITLKTDDGEVAIPFGNIKSGKLIMTDELVAAFLKKQKQPA